MIELTDIQTVFGGLFIVAAVMKFQGQTKTSQPKSPEFRKFQNNFITVFLIMMCADWMQGPYVYELYASYGFDKVYFNFSTRYLSEATIGYLFVAGFGSSAVCGPIIGALADTLGRKRMCIIFGISYFLSCVTVCEIILKV